MYNLEVCEHVDRKFRKIAKRERLHHEAIEKKIEQVLENPHGFEPLHAPMQGKYRVHIMGCFVLVFSIDEAKKAVVLLDYDHHDRIYKPKKN